MKKLLKNDAFQTLIASLACIIVGLFLGFIVLLFINPSGAASSIVEVIKNFMHFSSGKLRLKNLGNTLVKTAPLLMCSLSVLFAYKVGLFNIGAAGQYVVGSAVSLYCALALHLNWVLCILLAMLAGAVYAAIVGVLKALCNVNEVISGIMLNWIALYGANTILSNVKEPTSPYTLHITGESPSSLIPSLGLNKLFNNNNYVTIAIPLAVIIAIVILVLLNKTKLGYELKATGNNKNAAKYAGMAEKRNIILTLMISGALAALGGAFLYLSDYEQWSCSQSSVPGMGFNGIAAAFLGGLNPVGSILSSYFIQHITNGGAYVDLTKYSSQISDLISSIIIYLCGFVFFLKYAISSRLAKSEEKQARKVIAEHEKGGEE